MATHEVLPIPEPGSVWRHYKAGDLYVVENTAYDALQNDLLLVVIYRKLVPLTPDTQYWTRPLANWHAQMEPGVRRFTLVPPPKPEPSWADHDGPHG